jgi:hypothetical protein
MNKLRNTFSNLKMQIKSILYCISITLIFFYQCQAFPSSGLPDFNKMFNKLIGISDPNDVTNEANEPAWSSLKIKQISPSFKEEMFNSNELFARIEKCIANCLSKNKHSVWRGNCLAVECDIY